MAIPELVDERAVILEFPLKLEVLEELRALVIVEFPAVLDVVVEELLLLG